MKRLLFAALAFLPMSTAAQTVEQRNAIKHIAEASVLADLCPSMKLNNDRMLLIAVTYRLGQGDPENGPIAKAMRAARLKAEADVKPLVGQSDAACAMAFLMFGPAGGNVPDLLVKR